VSVTCAVSRPSCSSIDCAWPSASTADGSRESRIPVPLAIGVLAEGYPWNWSIYRWLDGAPASAAPIDDLTELAVALAHFLTRLQQMDPTGGPPPGAHNFFRGGPVETYDAETHDAIAKVRDQIPAEAATAVWEKALGTTWEGKPVWVHGDVAASNLLVRNGRLSAVIDFGSSGVGDPACDVAIAWTLSQVKAGRRFAGRVRSMPRPGPEVAAGRCGKR
jgi:aminoglycoside phosphotransferase (APT) family kinase protein